MVKVASILACMLMLSSIVPLGCAQPAEEPRPEFIEIVSQTISAEQGGTITITEEDSFEHAGFELYIPPGALDSDREITVGEIARADLPSLPEQYMSIGYEFFLGPSGLYFSSPATVRIPLSATVWQVCRNLASAEDFTLMKYDYPAGTWMALPTQVDNMGVITAEIEHFCFYSEKPGLTVGLTPKIKKRVCHWCYRELDHNNQCPKHRTKVRHRTTKPVRWLSHTDQKSEARPIHSRAKL